jgi:GNAT superfamily N-acetyltransferase
VEAVHRARDSDRSRCVELLTGAIQGSAGIRGARQLDDLGVFARAHRVDADDVPPTAAQLVEHWSSSGDDRTPLRALFVGTIDGVVVGLGAGALASAGPSAGRIECCYVEPEARGVGVGSRLMEALLAWFAEHHCTDVDALALPGDRSMKQLLERSGFKTRLLVLHHSAS